MQYIIEYGKDMEKDVKGDTSGGFKKVLNVQMSGGRDESLTYDLTAAKRDALELFHSKDKKWDTEDSL